MLTAVFTSSVEQDTATFAGADSVLENSVKIPQQLEYQFPITGSSATAWNPLALTLPLINPGASYNVVAAYYRPQIAGSTTVTLVHAIASTPIGSSVNIMTNSFSLYAATDVTQTAALVTGSSITTLNIGDQLGLRPATLGAASGQGLLTVVLQRN